MRDDSALHLRQTDDNKRLWKVFAWKWAENKPPVSDKARLNLLQAHTLLSVFLFLIIIIAVYCPKAFEKQQISLTLHPLGRRI